MTARSVRINSDENSPERFDAGFIQCLADGMMHAYTLAGFFHEHNYLAEKRFDRSFFFWVSRSLRKRQRLSQRRQIFLERRELWRRRSRNFAPSR